MTAEQLRNSLLQEAISGRLVPQNPNDEPASALLEKIRDEKARLIKEGKLKRDKPSAPITDDEKPFEIPASWEWVRMKDLADVVRGGSPRPAGSKEFYDGHIPFLKVADLTKDNKMYLSTFTATIKEAGLKKTRMVSANTLLLTNSGATLGVPKICTFDTTFNDGIAAFLNLFDDLKPYMYWFLCANTDYFRNYNQGTTQPNLNTDIIRNTLVPLPPLAEQKRIVAKLEELLPIVEQYGKAQTELDELNAALPARLRQSVLQQAIQGKLVPQDPTEGTAEELLKQIEAEKARLYKEKKISKNDFNVMPLCEEDIDFEIPTTWEWVRLGEIFKHSTGKALNEANRKGSLQDYITTSNVYWGYFKLDKLRQMYYTEDEKEKCMATKGDLLVLEGGDVGRSAIWDKDYDIYLQNHIHKLRAYIPVCTKFYYYCLYYLHSTQSVIGKGIGIQGLSSKALHNIVFPLPPLAEQQRIVAKIEDLFAEIDKLTK